MNAGTWIAFSDEKQIANGSPHEVAGAVRRVVESEGNANGVRVFDAQTGRPVDLDLRGSMDEVIKRYSPARTAKPTQRKGPGRPRLGVVAREVTLLPRHWAWLSQQRGGASATLRRLVDTARKSGPDDDRVRQAQDACYRFMNETVGNEPGFEDAMRYLYQRKRREFEVIVALWPEDLARQVRRLATPAFET